MTTYLSPVGNAQFFDSNGNPLVGGKLYTYVAGTTTPQATYTDTDGLTPQANPIILNSLGMPDSPIRLAGGALYKFQYKSSADVVIGNPYDDVLGVGDPSTSGANSTEWIYEPFTITYIGTTSFSVVGDKLTEMPIGTRLKVIIGSGAVYPLVSNSTYSSGSTTITLTEALIDSSISSVSYGIISSVYPSLPNSQETRDALGIENGEWLSSKLTPTYVSATSFTVAGDHTATFAVGVRLKSTNTGGTIYSSVSAVAYSSPNTTVTVTNDSGSLDSGLSAVYYSIINPTNPSIPNTDAIKNHLGIGSAVQIQSVAATVAGNDLTITLNPCKLDFRSTTLTTGAPTTVTLASAASIVVPSGATLGMTSGQAGNLAILAINNAGTIETAVCNIGGTTLLNEAGVINTTALSTGSDSADVVYSTTARTGVAYRVVGYITISEATAGTWATAPTLVQGAGGVATNHIGDSQQYSNVTGSRALGTTYYNTSPRMKWCIVQVSQTAADAGATATSVNININGTAVENAFTGQYVNSAGTYSTSRRTLTFAVPAGASYSISNSVGTSSLINWRELG